MAANKDAVMEEKKEKEEAHIKRIDPNYEALVEKLNENRDNEGARNEINHHIKTLIEEIQTGHLTPKTLAEKQDFKQRLERLRPTFSLEIAQKRFQNEITSVSDIDKQYEAILAQIPKISQIQDPDERDFYQDLLSKKCRELLTNRRSLPLKRAMAREGLKKINTLLESPLKQELQGMFTANVSTLSGNPSVPWYVAMSFIRQDVEQAKREMEALDDPERAAVIREIQSYEKKCGKLRVSPV